MSWLNHRYLLWLVLAAPALWWWVNYLRETVFYGELIHRTGDFSVQLLIVTLAVTPLSRLFPGARWVGWLSRRRRYLGVASFGYALFHTLVYLERKAQPELIFGEAAEPGLLTGWMALLLMLVLAATSNDRSVRWLKRRWKSLHRWIYPATALTFAHWILTAFDPGLAYVHLAIIGVLVLIRIALLNRGQNGHR